MALDASIYQGIRPVEMPSMLDSAAKAANLSSLAMQQQRMGQQMQSEGQEAKYKEHLQRASAFGNALESIAGMSDEQRAAAYPQVRNELLQAGIIRPEDAPADYDPGFYRQSLMRYRQSMEYLDKQLKQTQIGALQQKAEPQVRLSEAQKAVEREGGKEYVDWVVRGNSADVEKNLAQLEEVKEKLKKDFTTVGPVMGRVIPDWARPEGVAMREAVEEVIQRNLRAILGAQFTEKEGERLISRGYNEKLSPQENIKRLDRLITQMRQAKDAKDRAAEYYEKHGTLVGFKGQMPSAGMFAGGASGSSSGGQSSGAMSPNDAVAAPVVKPGHSEDGYVFMGGDPGDPKSWKRAR